MNYVISKRFSAILRILTGIAVVAAATLIFAYRYLPAFKMPNFYAEDGTVFIATIISDGLLLAPLNLFNGYLVIGQYLVADVAVVLNAIFGDGIVTLPWYVALASCAFLGLTASLPFLLLRKQMGYVASICAGLVMSFTPLPGSDYAVIGTIGNLKFAFIVWAVVFIFYRNANHANRIKSSFADLILLLCVLTNITTIALLPAALWPYRKTIASLITSKFNTLKKAMAYAGLFRITCLILLALVYGLAVYIKGIPEIPGYLDTPYNPEASDNIAFRVTSYAFLYPIAGSMTDKIAVISICILLALVLIVNRRRRTGALFILYAMIIATLSFVVSRAGIGDYMLEYIKTPDQFFYAQSMLAVFLIFWIVSSYATSARAGVGLVLVTLGFVILAYPYGSSMGKNSEIYSARGDIKSNLSIACKSTDTKKVLVAVYPSEPWVMSLPRKDACR